MKRYSIAMYTGAFLLAGLGLRAENVQLNEGKEAFANIKNSLVQMAEVMPEENYAFKPTPEIRSFGEMVAHVANAQAGICSIATGQKKAVNAKGTTSKAELIAALKDSSKICEAAWDGLTDASATETVTFGKAQRTKLGVMIFNSTHDNEEYGYMAVYLRLKGVVPPTSAK